MNKFQKLAKRIMKVNKFTITEQKMFSYIKGTKIFYKIMTIHF